MRRHRREAGFSLIELMIVLAIIAIILAFAIPSLMSSRKSANETAAIGNLRTLHSIQLQYRLQHGQYARSAPQLESSGLLTIPTGPIGMIEAQGYRVAIVAPNGTWWAVAFPLEPGITGDRRFIIGEAGSVRAIRDLIAVPPPVVPIVPPVADDFSPDRTDSRTF